MSRKSEITILNAKALPCSSPSVVIVIAALPQLSAKEKELEKLRADHAKIRAEIEEMMAGLNHEQVNVTQTVRWWSRKKFCIEKIGLENI